MLVLSSDLPIPSCPRYAQASQFAPIPPLALGFTLSIPRSLARSLSLSLSMAMDLSKKRKADENGGVFTTGIDVAPPLSLSAIDARKILETFTKDQLLDILQTVVTRDASVLDAVRAVADSDTTQRKLFIRGLGWESTTDSLHSIFSAFGELDEAIVITDKTTGKSKGYGFVTFKHIDGAILALREPGKKIDGRIAVAQLAYARDLGSVDVSARKIYVGNVPFEISSERLLDHFLAYGEIEEGPLGFDKQSGKQKGFAFFVYKTEEGARTSLVDPIKIIDGNQVVCKLATDGKKGKPGGGPGQTGVPGDAVLQPGSFSGPINPSYNMPGGLTPYNGFSGGSPALPHQNPHLNSSYPAAISSGQGFSNQGPSSFSGGAVGYGGGGTAAGYGGTTGAVGYGGGGGGGVYTSSSQYGAGPVSSEYGGMSNAPSSMNRVPQNSGGYPDGGSYSSSSSAYPTQLHQPPSGPRGPPSGMYPGAPPYY